VQHCNSIISLSSGKSDIYRELLRLKPVWLFNNSGKKSNTVPLILDMNIGYMRFNAQCTISRTYRVQYSTYGVQYSTHSCVNTNYAREVVAYSECFYLVGCVWWGEMEVRGGEGEGIAVTVARASSSTVKNSSNLVV